jgi:hypothetical protein
MICTVGGRAEHCTALFATALFATALFATALFATALFAGARRSVRSKRCPGPRQLPREHRGEQRGVRPQPTAPPGLSGDATRDGGGR